MIKAATQLFTSHAGEAVVPPRTVGAGRAVVVGRVAGLPAELGRGEAPLDQPREGEPIGRVVGAGRVVLGRVVLGRDVVPGRTVVGRDVVGRLVIEGRLVPVERGREVEGRVTGREVDGRLVGRVVEGRLVGREVLGRDCGLEVGRDGRLAGRDGRLVGRLVGRLWGRDGRLVWPRVRWAEAAPGALAVVAEGAAEAGPARAGPPSRARAMRPAATGVRRSRREMRGLVRSVMAIGGGESYAWSSPNGVPTPGSFSLKGQPPPGGKEAVLGAARPFPGQRKGSGRPPERTPGCPR